MSSCNKLSEVKKESDFPFHSLFHISIVEVWSKTIKTEALFFKFKIKLIYVHSWATFIIKEWFLDQCLNMCTAQQLVWL